MQVKMMGFKLEGDPSFSIDGMLDKFRSFNEKVYKSYTLYLRLSSEPSSGYLKGLIMYSTHNKTEHELVGKEIRKVDIKNNRIRANYFVINPVTYEGVYQAYFGSTSPKQFGNVLDWQYSLSKRNSVKTSIPAEATKEDKKREYDRARKSAPIKIVWMVSDGDYLKIAESLQHIDTAEIDLEGSVRDFERMSGLSSHARRRRLIYQFKDGSSKATILACLKQFSDLVTPEKVRIYGRLTDKLDYVLNSDTDNLEFLDVVDFDSISDKMTGNIDNFESHVITDDLIKLAQATFGK